MKYPHGAWKKTTPAWKKTTPAWKKQYGGKPKKYSQNAPQNPDQNPGRKSGQKPDRKSGLTMGFCCCLVHELIGKLVPLFIRFLTDVRELWFWGFLLLFIVLKMFFLGTGRTVHCIYGLCIPQNPGQKSDQKSDQPLIKSGQKNEWFFPSLVKQWFVWPF